MPARKRKTNLGSGRIYHAKGARKAYRYAMTTFDRAIADAERGDCRRALDKFAVANNDYGDFVAEFTHAVGAGPARPYRGPMAAPRMKQLISNKRMEALEAMDAHCLVKKRR